MFEHITTFPSIFAFLTQKSYFKRKIYTKNVTWGNLEWVKENGSHICRPATVFLLAAPGAIVGVARTARLVAGLLKPWLRIWREATRAWRWLVKFVRGERKMSETKKVELCECGKREVWFSISCLGGHWKNLCVECTKEFCAKKSLPFYDTGEWFAGNYQVKSI
jgi:hypothetical protein